MNLPAEIILASASEARRRLLASAGINVRSLASGVDEAALKVQFVNSGEGNTGKLAARLATAKAELVSAANGNDLVIGADQILILEGRVIDKPKSLQEARSQLLELRGKTHHLVCAIAAARKGRAIWIDSTTAVLSMRRFSEKFLEDYLSAVGDDVLTSVGSYKIEGRGVQLFDKISGDYFSILGLPLLPLLSFLRSQQCLPS
jgi:nucleoside triphosphate pyrophosphatase